MGRWFLEDMDDCPKVLYGWSWEENKMFEMALAVVDEQDPDRWKIVAAMVGGEKSAEDVQKHYVILLEDLKCIESGDFDHALFGELAQPFLQLDCFDSVFSTDEEDHLNSAGNNTKICNLFNEMMLSTLIDGTIGHKLKNGSSMAISSNQESFTFKPNPGKNVKHKHN